MRPITLVLLACILSVSIKSAFAMDHEEFRGRDSRLNKPPPEKDLAQIKGFLQHVLGAPDQSEQRIGPLDNFLQEYVAKKMEKERRFKSS